MPDMRQCSKKDLTGRRLRIIYNEHMIKIIEEYDMDKRVGR
jgi:hypothetical protein